jgi:hypothetical protein
LRREGGRQELLVEKDLGHSHGGAGPGRELEEGAVVGPPAQSRPEGGRRLAKLVQ